MMNAYLFRLIVLVCLLMMHQSAVAYKESTHIKFSEYAADNSILATEPMLLVDFGLAPYGTAEFVNSSSSDPMNLRDIIAFGSKFEDDGGSFFQLINPFITKRSLRHFFDPQSGNGLAGFATSPDWALERNPAGAVLDFDNPEQKYSYEDARKYFFAALTCQTAQCRKDNFSRTFQTIGHLIHHIQDMGQPQHSRLDVHLLGPRTFYEEYTATRETDLPTLITDNLYAPPPAGGNYFNLPRKYWQDGSGKGMAEFTGTHFVTMGSMFRRDKNTASGFASNKNFSLPTGAGITKRTFQTTLTGIGGETLPGVIETLEASAIIDPLNGPTGTQWTNVQLATISILDAHLNNNELGFDGEPLNVLTVNSKVFDDRLTILAPRIAALSTDFINYFFRGRIDMVADAGSSNSWRIVNNSTETMSGRFDLYAESSNGDRTIVTGWNLTIPAGGSSASQTFQVPAGSVRNYVLVFKGQMGVEVDAVAGKVVTISPVAECGVPLAPRGGQGNNQNFQYAVSGSVPQKLIVAFEAYYIPDSLQVSGNGRLLVNTNGLVSGFHQFDIDYDPNIHGSTLDVQVDAPNDGTAWEFCVNCESSTTSCSLIQNRQDVSIFVNEGNISKWDCNVLNIFVDDQRIGSSFGNIRLSSGVHEFGWDGSCFCTDNGVIDPCSGAPYVSINNTRYSLPSATSQNYRFLFSIN